jgi:hypothetical protein
MLLKNQTPLFVALVAFVTMFVFLTAVGILMPPLRGRMPSLGSTLIRVIGSGGVACLIWVNRRNAARR